MHRRVSKRKNRSHPPYQAQPASPCRALVLADGAAIRKKIKKDYEKALRDLDSSRKQLDQFDQSDKPQFTRWLNAHFGALLTELREFGQKLAADQELILQVQYEIHFGGGPPARAYQRVMKLRENPEPPPPPRGDSGEPARGDDPFHAQPESGHDDPDDDPLREFFEHVFGGFGAGPDGDSWQDRRSPAAADPESIPPHTAGRLKDLYRALVRRLHPDAQAEMTPQKIEWWHQAQAAYEAGDAGQLEVILTLCEIGESGTTAHTSASLLQRITAQLKTSLSEIKRQLRDRRHDPAWGFSRRSDHEALATQTRNALRIDLENARQLWRETQETIAGWKAAAENLKPPRRRRKRQEPDLEFPF